MNVKKIISDTLITLYITILLLYILISNVKITYDVYTVYDLSVGLMYFCIFGILIYLFNKVLNKIKFDMYDLLIFCLIFFGVVSTIYAINVDVAFWGFKGRYEGLVQLILYYTLFLNCKNMYSRKNKIILIGMIIALAVVQAIYGILQFVEVKNVYDYEIIRNRFYSSGFEVNPNFFGTLMIIGLSLSLSIYFIKKNGFIALLTLCTSVILFLGVLCSGAMSVAVAIIFMFFCLIASFFVLKLNFWNTLIKCMVIFICFFISYKFFNMYDNGYYASQIDKSGSEMVDVLSGEAKPIYGSGRIHIWTQTLKIVPNNLWNGVGIDNFYYAFGEKVLRDVKSGLIVDKAHNEYLQKLITEGIFSIIVYLSLLIIIFIKSFKKILVNKNKTDYLLPTLFLCFICYCIQAFFNISIISVAPIFYIIMGILCSLIKGGSYDDAKY